MDDDYYLEQQKKLLELEERKASQGNVLQDTQAMQLREQQRSMIYDQLNLGEELEIIENLLRGNILKQDEQGVTKWIEPTDNEMVVLSDHGVHLIMNTISFYLNKNTLLSNYDENTINSKMEDFSTDLTDTIFMEYEKVFKYPTFEECKEVLEKRIDKKTELRKFAREIMGEKDIDEVKIKRLLIKEIETKIEVEIEKIKQQIIKNKLKRFLIIIREIQDTIHSTYLRALFGAERRTLRQHIHVSETSGMNMQPQKQPSKLNPMNFFRFKK